MRPSPRSSNHSPSPPRLSSIPFPTSSSSPFSPSSLSSIGCDDFDDPDPFSDLRSVSAGPRLSSRTTSRNIPTSALDASPDANSTTPPPRSLKAALADAVTYRPSDTPHKYPQRGSSFSPSTAAPAADLPKESSMDDIPDYYKAEFAAENPFSKKEAKGSSRDRKKGEKKKKTRAAAPLDFIDTLDTIGGFHHDGPFDAANAHRNRDTRSRNPSRQAPIAAFDPASLSAEGALRTAGGAGPSPNYSSQALRGGGASGRPSARAQAALAAMGNNDGDVLSGASPGPRTTHEYPPGAAGRRGSEGSLHQISMGYPAGKIAKDPKAASLAEAFGIMDQEAWEDFGRTRGGGAVNGNAQVMRRGSEVTIGGGGEASSVGTGAEASEGEGVGTGAGEKGEVVAPKKRIQRAKTTGGLNSERNFKAASVWDMEATLREGKPVAAVPPVPALPGFMNSENAPNGLPAHRAPHLTPVKKPNSPLRSHSHSASYSSHLESPGSKDSGSPKRSKSLVARIKKGVRSPNVPVPQASPSEQSDGLSAGLGGGDEKTPPRPPRPEQRHSLGSPSLLSRANNNPTSPTVLNPLEASKTSPPRSPEASRHEYLGGAAAGGIGAAPESPPPVRKPSLFQKMGFRQKTR